MNVLVDTSVWSAALRRSTRSPASETAAELAELIRDGRAQIIGPIRQELLSGVKSAEQFQQLRERLRAFPDLDVETGDFEEAAELANRCRAKGVQGSSIDFLICAVALRRELSIFTTDRDFTHFSSVLPLELYRIQGRGS